ncbi:hypothetical protein KBY75_13800 [Cyanobium sp. T1G-Tous]|uniref:hypothetical protein n=1 Tax=Cyanobium sp. T1G-Tous TaxID=2823722 RepID=UPI0020CBD448|nr:hypothetical protein [Cyanobium sp. T1G-Tous]MCP9804638.1 hypothetical protein [Cyanobium sp. T1G-Tous]
MVLVLGVVALSSRSSQGFISSIFQGVNREARETAESAISDFGVTMNREENRLLLVAGNDSSWTSDEHRNLCTASTQAADGTWSAVPADLAIARARSTPTSASRFVRTGNWVPLIAGDTTRSFKVTKVEYFFEENAERTPFNFATGSINFPGKTVRDSALEGGTRTLMRVTVVGRISRNGQSSYARVAREFEVVPKCCKRSFGNNSGSVPWGRDNATCPVGKDTGVGNGVIGSLDGGSPTGSNNELDIRDENNTLVKQAICWMGNTTGVVSDLDGDPSQECKDGTQALGKATPQKTSLKFAPTKFSLKLPEPRWNYGGRLAPQPGAPLTVANLNSQFPTAYFGTWISDGTNYWMRLFDEEWKAFGTSPSANPWTFGEYSRVSGRIQVVSNNHGLNVSSPVFLYPITGSLVLGNWSVWTSPSPAEANLFNINNTTNNSGDLYWMGASSSPVTERSFLNCSSATTDISLCRWEEQRIVFNSFGARVPSCTNPAVTGCSISAPTRIPYPQVSNTDADSTILSSNFNKIPQLAKAYNAIARIYLDPSSMIMMQKIGSATATPMTNCIVNKDPAAPYAVVDCRFSQIASGNDDVFIDTSYAMINFHFDDLAVTGEYMGGGGNTSYKRVHCSRASWTAACDDLVTWADFQIKCDIVSGSDPNCATGKNSNYDHSELFNAFTLGAGKFFLNGTSSTVGMNVYAPFATVELKGGGRADPNFMGRIWTNTIALNGNVKLRVPNSQPSFCSNTICPPPSRVPLFDLVARSFSHASGF